MRQLRTFVIVAQRANYIEGQIIGRVTNIRNYSGLVSVHSTQWGLHGVYSQEIPKIDGCALELSVSLSSSQSSTTLPYSLRDLSDVNVIPKLKGHLCYPEL